MRYGLAVTCLVLYLVCSTWFLLSSVIQLHLLWLSRRKKDRSAPARIPGCPPLMQYPPGELPAVTIQVPVFNERYVIARLLMCLAELDYPLSLLDIQVLDDSTDDTSVIIRNTCAQLRSMGIDVTILQRTDRTGFKAGALQAALPHVKGSLIAIFDADFTPEPDFLRRMVIHFNDQQVGGVQSRWQHRNLRESWLTIIQCYLLDSHFTIEQQGRFKAGFFVNFNGTAGMWRRQCIVEAGGWNGRVLTEDLELSYRAQLQGWKFVIDTDITVMADLPADVNAFKVQQFRWAKGMAQVATLHLGRVLGTPMPLLKKMHAIFHLLGSVSFLSILGSILFALPVIIARHSYPSFVGYSPLIMCTGVTLPIICTFYYSGTSLNLSRREFWTNLPLFLVVYMALAVRNSVAVIQGWSGVASPFVRTPKPGDKQDSYREHAADRDRIGIPETFVLAWVLVAIIMSLAWKDYLLLMFLLMQLIGLILLLTPWKARPENFSFLKPTRLPFFHLLFPRHRT